MRRHSIALYLLTLCSLVLCAKLLLIWRININWDEFFYLSHVYTAANGAMTRVFQQPYVHLFAWLPQMGDNEIDQIIVARVAMLALFVITVVLIAKLAGNWTTYRVAWFGPLAFLAASPVLRHGASFRSDSLLAPLALLSILAVSSERLSPNRLMAAGLFFGLSLAVSLKSVLILPLLLALMMTARDDYASSAEVWWGFVSRAGRFGAISAGTAGLVLGMHWLTLSQVDEGAIQGFASGAAQKMLIDAPFFPRWDYFQRSLENDWPTWLLILAGLAVAAVQRSRAALLALSLAPLVVYRNAFPYYYVVMLAPASVLAAVTVDALMRGLNPAVDGSSDARRAWIPVALSVPLVLQISLILVELSVDRQVEQRRTIDAVHQIFDKPVPYIDHSGMISSFPKANFFMSSWGVEKYRSGGTGFMAPLLEKIRPPLLVANHAILLSGSEVHGMLLPEDRKLIASSYIPYWGIIMVAGASADLPSGESETLGFPFPGDYRLEADLPLLIDGVLYENGDIVDIGDHRKATVQNSSEEWISMRLVWAEASPSRPTGIPPFPPIYSPF